jgi:hypothetical protein
LLSEVNGTSTKRLDKVFASVIFLSLKPREKYQKLKCMKNMAISFEAFMRYSEL